METRKIRLEVAVLGLQAAFALAACRPDSMSLEAVQPPEAAYADSAFSDLVRPLLALAREHPDSAEAHGELGLLYEANELWPEAKACYQIAGQLDSSSGVWELHAAIVLQHSGNYPVARTILENLAVHFPNSAPVWQQLGLVTLEMGEPVVAEDAFRRVTEIAPMRAHGYVRAADALIQQGRPETAVQAVKLGLERDPEFRMAHYILGTAYQRLGRTEEAEIELARGADAVLEYLPDPLTRKVQRYTLNPSKLSLIAKLLVQDGAHRAAAQMLERAHRYHPDDPILLNNLAVVYMEMGRMNDASELLVEASRQPDPALETFVNLAYYFSRTGQADSARSSARRALQLAPESHAAHLSLAQAEMALGDMNNALKSTRRALELGAYSARAFGLLGDVHFRLGDASSACEHLGTAVSIDPNLAPAWIRLAEAHMALGRTDEARRAIETARQIDPSNPLIQYVDDQLGTPTL